MSDISDNEISPPLPTLFGEQIDINGIIGSGSPNVLGWRYFCKSGHGLGGMFSYCYICDKEKRKKWKPKTEVVKAEMKNMFWIRLIKVIILVL